MTYRVKDLFLPLLLVADCVQQGFVLLLQLLVTTVKLFQSLGISMITKQITDTKLTPMIK